LETVIVCQVKHCSGHAATSGLAALGKINFPAFLQKLVLYAQYVTLRCSLSFQFRRH